MASIGSSVYAFDCTVKQNPKWKAFNFHPWCVGKPRSFENNTYSNASESKNFIFYQLSEIKKKMNHPHIDMLKLDIEGFEWDIFESEFINGRKDDLPTQLLFELHTQGSNPLAVPTNIVKGKTRFEVALLISKLRKLGMK